MESQIKTSTVYRIKKETVITHNEEIIEGPIIEEFEVPLIISICSGGVQIMYYEESDEKNWWNYSRNYKFDIHINNIDAAKSLFVNVKNNLKESDYRIGISLDNIVFHKESNEGNGKYRNERYTIYWDDKGRNEFLDTLKRLFKVLEEYIQL